MTRVRKPPPAKMTESDLLDRLERKLCQSSQGGRVENGGTAVFLRGVRDKAGFDAGRTIDGLSMGMWPSRGLWLHAYEVKCSRSDWLRELREGAKAEAFGALVDFFSLVVADPSIVEPGELPAGWGLLVPHGKGLKAVTEPVALRDLSARPAPLPPNFSRSFLAALLRSAVYRAAVDPQEITDARQEGRKRAEEDAAMRVESAEARYKELHEQVRTFQQAAGIVITGGYRWNGHGAKEVGDAVRAVLAGDDSVRRLKERLIRLEEQATGVADAVREQLADLERTDPQRAMPL